MHVYILFAYRKKILCLSPLENEKHTKKLIRHTYNAIKEEINPLFIRQIHTKNNDIDILRYRW